MDFVKGLGDAAEVMEMPVDGIGRFELHKGRLRVTLTRVIERNGISREIPCLTLVWSMEAWLAAFRNARCIRNALCEINGHDIEETLPTPH